MCVCVYAIIANLIFLKKDNIDNSVFLRYCHFSSPIYVSWSSSFSSRTIRITHQPPIMREKRLGSTPNASLRFCEQIRYIFLPLYSLTLVFKIMFLGETLVIYIILVYTQVSSDFYFIIVFRVSLPIIKITIIKSNY